MAKRRRIAKEIVLYHGSLEELNSRDPSKQFKFARELEFFSQPKERYDGRWREYVANDLRKQGYNGLVNVRQSCFSSYVMLEGTPIIRVK